MHSASPPIAHLDIKPENVLVSFVLPAFQITAKYYMQVEDITLHTYIADFGLGKTITTNRVMGTYTKAAGTPGFRSPEQLNNEGISTMSDVYALGAVLTELFGGEPIWPNMDCHTIIMHVGIKKIMPNITHLPEKIQSIVKCCLCPVQKRSTAAVVLAKICDIDL